MLQFRRMVSHLGPLHMWKFELRRTIRFARAMTPAWPVTLGDFSLGRQFTLAKIFREALQWRQGIVWHRYDPAFLPVDTRRHWAPQSASQCFMLAPPDLWKWAALVPWGSGLALGWRPPLSRPHPARSLAPVRFAFVLRCAAVRRSSPFLLSPLSWFGRVLPVVCLPLSSLRLRLVFWSCRPDRNVPPYSRAI